MNKYTIKAESNKLRSIYRYMTRKNLTHEDLVEEILNKKCELSSSIRGYILKRDSLKKKIVLNES